MTSQNETSLPTTNFSGATSGSGILSWFYLKHMVFPVHVYKICHCFGIRKYNDCCNKSEAIFVDDQSHEIKAMHGACKTLQVSGMWNGGHFGSIWAPRKPMIFLWGWPGLPTLWYRAAPHQWALVGASSSGCLTLPEDSILKGHPRTSQNQHEVNRIQQMMINDV